MWNSLNFVLESYFEYRDALALSRLFVVFLNILLLDQRKSFDPSLSQRYLDRF